LIRPAVDVNRNAKSMTFPPRGVVARIVYHQMDRSAPAAQPMS
jgi:hypothetical protein